MSLTRGVALSSVLSEEGKAGPQAYFVWFEEGRSGGGVRNHGDLIGIQAKSKAK